MNSLFTTKPVWSNCTYLLSILSSGLRTGSKNVSECFFKKSWIPWLDAIANSFLLHSRWSWSWNAHLPDLRVCGGSIHPAKPWCHWGAVWQSKTPMHWGTDWQTEGKKSLYSFKRKKSNSKTHVLKNALEWASCLKSAVLLPLQYVFSSYSRNDSFTPSNMSAEQQIKEETQTWIHRSSLTLDLQGHHFNLRSHNSPTTLCIKINFCPYITATCEGVLSSLGSQKACCCRKTPQEVPAPARLICCGITGVTEEQGEGNGWWNTSYSAAQWRVGRHV